MQDGNDSGHDLTRVVSDLIEDVVVNVLETLRERPALAAVVAASAVGAVIGIVLTTRARRPAPQPLRAASGLAAAVATVLDQLNAEQTFRDLIHGARRTTRRSRGTLDGSASGLSARADLVPLALRALSNPVVRAYLTGMIGRRFARSLRH